MSLHASSRARGRTIAELTIASAAMVAILAAAVPAFFSVSKAADEGTTRTLVETDNRGALAKMGRELQNTSLSLLNDVGQPVFAVTIDGTNAPSYLVGMPSLSGDEVGGPNGNGPKTKCVACQSHTCNSHTCGLPDGVYSTSSEMGDTPLNPDQSGSGRRGRTMIGRTRDTTSAGYTFGDGSNRARTRVLPGNSIMTFQKVTGYTIDVTGEPLLEWSTPITYSTQGRALVRIQDGVVTPISRNCSCFYVEQTDSDTVVISIVSERRAPGTSEITKQSNQIEVRPKN